MVEAMKTKPDPVALLPAQARHLLSEAAKTHEPGSFARQKAIDAAIERVRLLFPECFKPEPIA